jgi:hypothetical protein
MTTTKKQFENFQTKFGDSFSLLREGVTRALEQATSARNERLERLDQQRRLLHFIQIKHANILRALADR